MEERNEIVITTISRLNQYLNENANADTIVSITIEPGDNTEKGGGDGEVG